MWRAERFRAVGLLCAGMAALVSGCAGGAWLESPIEAEVPIQPPKHGYPTAVSGVSAKKPAVGSLSADDGGPASHPTVTPSHRLDRPQVMLTPLAVVPQELVRGGSNGAAPPGTAPGGPAVATATLSHPTPTGVANSVGASPGPSLVPANGSQAGLAPPSSAVVGMPGIDVSGLEALARFDGRASEAIHDGGRVGGAPGPGLVRANEVSLTTAEAPAERQGELVAVQPTLEEARRSLIGALETEIRQRKEKSASDEELPRLEQQLRLAYLAAGKMEEAVAAVESLDAAQKEAYKNLMFGLGVWLSPDESRRAPLRTAKVLHSLRDATSDLAGASKLELKNLVFCEQVDQFGWYTEFPRREFQPRQQVILYAEVENFAAETKGPAGFETELQGSYVILDSSGQEVASRQLQLDKEICRNYRRDYFLAYRIYLPENISPGRYRLELTVEDMKARGKYAGRKLGEGVVEFTVR